MVMYALPSMSRPEIISFLSDSQIITLSDADLLNPTPNLILNLYTSLLHHVSTLMDDQDQLDFAALERLDNPDMHVDSFRIMRLYTQIKDVLESIECPTAFTLNDLVHPNASRTAKFLTAIINFSLYRDSKLNMMSPYGDQIALLEEQRMQEESKILQLREEIEAIKEVRDREKPLVQEAEAKVKELRQAIDDLNTLQSNLRKERQAMKEKAHELNNNISTAEFELIQATEENAIWRSKIVQSPMKLQRALEEKKAVVMEAKDSERLAMQRFQEKSAVLEVYTKASEKMTKQLAQMQTLHEQVNSAKSVEKDVKQLKAKLSDEQMLGISLEAKVTECEAKAEKLDKEKRELEKEKNLRREKDSRGLNDVKLEAESRRNDLEERRRKIDNIVVEADVVKAKTSSVKELAAATQAELLRKSEEIVNEVNSAKSVEKDVKQLKAKLSDEEMLGISLEAKVTECEAKAEKLDKEKRELEKEKKIRREKDSRGLNEVKLEAESRRNDLEERRRKIDSIVVEVDVVKAKTSSVKELAAATQAELLRKSEEIVNEVNAYSSSKVQVMSRIAAAGNKDGF